MNSALQLPGGENQVSLRRALRTLRAVQQRYAVGRDSHPAARCYTVQLALGSGDMLWVNAAIETLERAIAAETTMAAKWVPQARRDGGDRA
jgi:hypothetical protein